MLTLAERCLNTKQVEHNRSANSVLARVSLFVFNYVQLTTLALTGVFQHVAQKIEDPGQILLAYWLVFVIRNYRSYSAK